MKLPTACKQKLSAPVCSTILDDFGQDELKICADGVSKQAQLVKIRLLYSGKKSAS